MKKEIKKEFVVVDIKDIIPYKNNPRLNAEAVEKVKESIEQCGYVNPIVIDEDNIILAGHTRHKSLLQLGVDKIKCLKVSGLSEDDKKKFRLYDNKTSELAEWDYEKLWQGVTGLDFEGYDFSWGLDEKKPIEEENTEKEKKNIKCPYCGYEFEE